MMIIFIWRTALLICLFLRGSRLQGGCVGGERGGGGGGGEGEKIEERGKERERERKARDRRARALIGRSLIGPFLPLGDMTIQTNSCHIYTNITKYK